ncbi:MAG TPA: hypothetical protein VGD74_12425 [Vulgatibacter sp.]
MLSGGFKESLDVPGVWDVDFDAARGLFAPSLDGIVVVGGGRSPEENGQELLKALAGIADGANLRLRLGPGVFELPGGVRLGGVRAVEGSGLETIVRFKSGGVEAPGPMALERLSLERHGAGLKPMVAAQASLYVDGVFARMTSSGEDGEAVVFDLVGDAKHGVFKNSRIEVEGAKAGWAIRAQSASLRVEASEIVIDSASGSNSGYGIQTSGESLEVENVRIHLSGDGRLIGIGGPESLSLRNSDVDVDGKGTGVSGLVGPIRIESSRVVLTGQGQGVAGGSRFFDGAGGKIEIVASQIESGGTAVLIGGSGPGISICNLESSQIKGTLAAVSGTIENIELRIGSSRVSGGIDGIPVAKCVFSYDGDFDPLGPDCS